MLSVKMTGQQAASAVLNKHHEAAVIIGRWRVVAGASAPYARYVHEGTRRMPARPFLAQALAAVRPRLASRLAAAIPRGPRATEGALDDTEREVKAEAQRRSPVLTGKLRSSIYTRVGQR